MPDEIERAQRYDEIYRQQALQAHYAGRNAIFDADSRQTRKPRPADGEGGKSQLIVECIDCGEEIDPARLRAKPDAVRCIDCQTKFERIYGKRS